MSYRWCTSATRNSLVLRPYLSFLIGLTPFACAESDKIQSYSQDAGSSSNTAVPSSEDGGQSLDGAPPPPCGPSGFCPTPLPVQRPLVAISGSGPDDVWATGGDAILRWDGGAWTVMYQYREPRSDFFTNIWVRSRDDVWALGDSLVVHYSKQEGQLPVFRELPISFQRLPGYDDRLSLPQSVSWLAPNSDDLWVVIGNTIYRFAEGLGGSVLSKSWTLDAYFQWGGIWGFASDDVYAAGWILVSGKFDGIIAHFDGSSWKVSRYPAASYGGSLVFREVRGVVESADNEKSLFVNYSSSDNAGVAQLAVAGDGSAGELRRLPLHGLGMCGGSNDTMFVRSPNEAWLAKRCLMFQWDGSDLARLPLTSGGDRVGGIKGIWASGPDDVWIVGQSTARESWYQPVEGFALHRTSRPVPEEARP
jgi:hypothetical protein